MGSLTDANSASVEFTDIVARFDDDVLTVRVEEGVRRVRLSALNTESGVWELVQVTHLSGEAGYIKLRVPDGRTRQELKVEVSTSDPFPYHYYSGKSSFGQTTSLDEAAARQFGVDDIQRSDPQEADPEGGEGSEVVESDIWHIQGERLYFFNQLRGLQIFDLNGDPEPTKLGSLRLPAVGEQMYVLDDRYTILLAAWNSRNQSEVILAEYDETNGLREAHRIGLPGNIAETRLIGDMLYVVTRFSEYTMIEEPAGGGDGGTGNGGTVKRWVYKTGLDLTVIDFSDPAAPRELEGLQLSEQDTWGFYNAQVAATSTHILVSTTNYANQRAASDVFVIDISDQKQAPELVAEVPVAGSIADKFKMRLEDNVLTTVSQVNDWSDRRFETAVETFEIGAEHEDGFNPLDEVRLGVGEQLFATRFDGDRLYIVTFLRIDPFWVVDLADPGNLRILGELEVPGFSRYLQPVGDNILAIGVEDRVVTASLFNATDPSNPLLLSRVSMGEGFSWSEANYDEKAISFNEAEGLLLVPYQSYNNGESEQRVQIIDVAADSLTKRGTIDHGFPPRRAGVWNNRIVSVSGRELIVVDAANRDHPAVLSNTVIAWNADRVIEAGGYLFQLEEGAYSYWETDSPSNSLRVTTAEDPDTVVSELALGGGVIIGSDFRDGCLYLLASEVNHVPYKDGEGNEVTRPERTLRMAVVDISDPSSVKVLGETDYKMPGDEKGDHHHFGAGELKPIWLPGGEIAWSTSGSNYSPCRWCFTDTVLRADVGIPIYQQPQVEVHVVDVSDKASPVFVSSSIVSAENSWSYSKPFLLNGNQIAYSYQKNTWLVKKERYLNEHCLRVVDLENPAKPVMLDEVSIPGRLSSVVRTEGGGTVLITEAQQSALGETPQDRWWQDAYLQASVYDGVSTFILDEVLIPGGGNASPVFDGASSFRQVRSENSSWLLLGYVWDQSTGLFVKSGTVSMEKPVSQLAVFDGIVFGWQWPSSLIGVDISDPLVPGQVEKFPLASNLWVKLERIQVDRSAGAWLPTGRYGVEFMHFSGAFDQAAGSPGPVPPNEDNGAWIDVSLNAIQSTDSESDGRYAGFLSSANGKRIKGYFEKINVRPTGTFSAKMLFGNTSYLIKGNLEDGRYSGIVTAETGGAAQVNLRLVQTAFGSYEIEGTVQAGSQTANVQAIRAGEMENHADAYTLLVPGENDASAPKGNGFGTMKITARGKAKIRGMLGDGNKWTAKCAVTPDGEMPLYVSLYNGAGSLGGMVRFRNVNGVSDCDGKVHWRKPGSFDLKRDLIGSSFSSDIGPLIGELPDKLPNLELKMGLGPAAFSNDFEWRSYNEVWRAGPDRLKIRVSPRNGRVWGKLLQGDTQFKICGVVFQKQGLFAGIAQTEGTSPQSLVILPSE